MLNTTDSSAQFDRLGKAIGAYKVASGRVLAFAVIKTGRELAFALFQETAKTTPTKSSLMELPAKLGWNDRSLRKHPKRTSGSAWARHQIIKFGGVQEMIERRIKSRFFAASGWRPAIKGFISKGMVTTVEKRLGGLKAGVSLDGNCRIVLYNDTVVIATLFKEHGIMEKVVNRVLAGYRPYINLKLGEAAAQEFGRI